jgi:hypothetical protein
MPYFCWHTKVAPLRGQTKCEDARLNFRKGDIALNVFFNNNRSCFIAFVVVVAESSSRSLNKALHKQKKNTKKHHHPTKNPDKNALQLGQRAICGQGICQRRKIADLVLFQPIKSTTRRGQN